MEYQTNDMILTCPRCKSFENVLVADVYDMEIKDSKPPYKSVILPHQTGCYCFACDLFFITSDQFKEILSECKEISGDSDFEPELKNVTHNKEQKVREVFTDQAKIDGPIQNWHVSIENYPIVKEEEPKYEII